MLNLDRRNPAIASPHPIKLKTSRYLPDLSLVAMVHCHSFSKLANNAVPISHPLLPQTLQVSDLGHWAQSSAIGKCWLHQHSESYKKIGQLIELTSQKFIGCGWQPCDPGCHVLPARQFFGCLSSCSVDRAYYRNDRNARQSKG